MLFSIILLPPSFFFQQIIVLQFWNSSFLVLLLNLLWSICVKLCEYWKYVSGRGKRLSLTMFFTLRFPPPALIDLLDWRFCPLLLMSRILLNHENNASLHITVIDTWSCISKHSKQCDYHGQTNISTNNLSGRLEIQVAISAVEKSGFLNLILI